MLISLGCACKVREAIQRKLNVSSLETNMFDWVISNFETVLYFIKNIDKLITESDFVDSRQVCLQHRIIPHRFLRFESLHDSDISNDYDTELTKLVDKYNRRLNRLKVHILSNKKIDFIHLIHVEYNFELQKHQTHIPSVEQIQEFTETILKINPTCNFNLHILTPPLQCKKYNWNLTIDKTQIDKLKINNNIFLYYLQQDVNKEPFADQCQHWSWSEVFKNIK